MSTKWDDTSWQEEFLAMKTHKPEVVRLLIRKGQEVSETHGNWVHFMRNTKLAISVSNSHTKNST